MKDEVDVVTMLDFVQFRCVTLLLLPVKATYCLRVVLPSISWPTLPCGYVLADIIGITLHSCTHSGWLVHCTLQASLRPIAFRLNPVCDIIPDNTFFGCACDLSAQRYCVTMVFYWSEYRPKSAYLSPIIYIRDCRKSLPLLPRIS
jgi:hypothetical protein